MMMDFDKAGGLIPAVVQDEESGEVLQVAFMNQEAFDLTRSTGKMHYYSRSRQKLWMKGETSGHFQEVREILIDCDQDTAVFKVRQTGGACHKGYRSCFFRRLDRGGSAVPTGADKVFDPAEVYKS